MATLSPSGALEIKTVASSTPMSADTAVAGPAGLAFLSEDLQSICTYNEGGWVSATYMCSRCL